MSKLAIDGGEKVFETPAVVPCWPPRYPETAERLKEIYLNEGWSFYGAEELKFNQKYAEFTGAKYSVMMANGTVTLELALQAMGIGPGDEVIVPAFTWLATGSAVVYRGATPVIVDIEPDTLCMDPVKCEQAITCKTRAIIPVHILGSIANMDKIMDIAQRYNLKVIEDCAHAHGGFWDGKHVGTIGDVGSFSFQQSKIIASGEGGACITNDDYLAETLGRLSHIGYPFAAKQGQKYTAPPMGLICQNYRVTDFQACILSSQLDHLHDDNMMREKNAEFLRAKLDAIPGLKCQARGAKATMQSFYMFAILLEPARLKDGITRQQVIAALQAEGVTSLGACWGHPMYRQNLWSIPATMYRIESCAVAEDIIYNRLMTLPLRWLMLTQNELEKIVAAFQKVMTEYSK